MDDKQTARRTVLDLAKWKPGKVVYFVTHYVPTAPKVKRKDLWMVDGTVHPYNAYRRGVLKSSLGRQTKLPKMHALEFDWIMSLLQSRLIIAEFTVASVERCPLTGECQYLNQEGDIMPESCLFEVREEAEAELLRIMDLFRRWACGEPSY